MSDERRDARQELTRLSFPGTDLARALRAVLIPSGLPLRDASLPPLDPRRRASWLREAPKALGLDATFAAHDLAQTLDALSADQPMLVLVRAKNLDCVVAVLGGRVCRVQTSSGAEAKISPTRLIELLANAGAESSGLQDLLLGFPDGERVVRALSKGGNLGERTFFVTTFRLDATHTIWEQARRDGAFWRALAFASVSLLRVALRGLAAFWMGVAAIEGRVEPTRIVGWTLLVLTDLPLGYAARLLYGRLTTNIAGAIKRRILEGAFNAEPAEVVRSGLGRILARANEASTIEQGGVAEIASGVVAIGYWLGASVLVIRSPVVWLIGPLFLVFTAIVAFLVYRQTVTYAEEYEMRSDLTDGLVERLLGHRTRLLQRTPANVHAGEDEMLEGFGRVSATRDRLVVWGAVMPRAWQLASFAVLALAFVWHEPSTLVLAFAIFAGQAAYSGIQSAATQWAPWFTAWRALEGLIKGGRAREKAWRHLPEQVEVPGKRPLALTMSRVSFAHRPGGRNVLDEVSLQLFEGERVLLQGPSGGGKSTLASLLASERRPGAGSVLVRGLDMDSVPKDEWRTRVAYAPQFHENFVFTNTFAFNLDPRADGEVTAEALAICGELGLDRVLDRMPAGTSQLLGETGWQLSHGEKSRLYIARALLQGAEIVIFDESFGALDPETLMTVMECVRKRAKTLIVIAHP